MKKIAIVDDEQDILNILEEFFNRSNEVSVTTFNNPATALDKIKSGSYDLILLDIMMPQLDGISFLEKIKESNPEIKVIMMTAYTTLERSIKSHKLGAENYLTKPFKSLNDVKTRVFEELQI
ncbi:MAG: response regulator [Arcobacteraceae bacterium]|nr:response regulator [Arcobacteraceae bacterium]